MIPKSELIEMFQAIAEQTDWDMSGEMLWGYFFTDESEKKLRACLERLKPLGYRYVDIMEGDEADDPLTLHVERIEAHSPDTLDQRNHELAAIAQELDLLSYDGMDVGPIDGDDDEYDEFEDDE